MCGVKGSVFTRTLAVNPGAGEPEGLSPVSVAFFDSPDALM